MTRPGPRRSGWLRRETRQGGWPSGPHPALPSTCPLCQLPSHLEDSPMCWQRLFLIVLLLPIILLLLFLQPWDIGRWLLCRLPLLALLFFSAKGTLMSHVMISHYMRQMKEQEEEKRRGPSCPTPDTCKSTKNWLTCRLSGCWSRRVLMNISAPMGFPPRFRGAWMQVKDS